MTKAEMVNEVMKMISDAEKPSTKAAESVLDALDRLNMLKAQDVGQMDRFSQMGVKVSFLMSHVQYEALDEKEKRELLIDVQRKAWSWAQEELDDRNAQWMIVCGGEVIESSSTLDDSPDEERLAAIGRRRGFVPFVSVRNPVLNGPCATDS